MQQRRYRPGDVLDDYCPRERRITDHAIVAMIDDNIKQTRCVVCDAEHEYKDGKVPAQRRKKPQAALFAEVLEGLQPPQPAVRLTPQPADADADEREDADEALAEDELLPDPVAAAEIETSLSALDAPPPPAALADDDEPVGETDPMPRDEGPVRRQLIRAALPRPEGQPPQPTRVIPEFTVRQAKQRGHRHGRRGPGGGGGHTPFGAGPGASRFSRNGGQGRPRRRRGKKG